MMHPYQKYLDLIGPENPIFPHWTTDASGNNCLVGLNAEQTKEYITLAFNSTADSVYPNWRKIERAEREKERNRYLELDNQYRIAEINLIVFDNE